MRERRVTVPTYDFNDVARLQWETYVESKTTHQHDEPVKPSRRRMRPGEEPSAYHEEGLLRYHRAKGR